MKKTKKCDNLIRTKCVKMLILGIVILFFVMLFSTQTKAETQEIPDFNNDGK